MTPMLVLSVLVGAIVTALLYVAAYTHGERAAEARQDARNLESAHARISEAEVHKLHSEHLYGLIAKGSDTIKHLTDEIIEQKRLGFAREVAAPVADGRGGSMFPDDIAVAIAWAARGSQTEEQRLFVEARRMLAGRELTDEVIQEVAAKIRHGEDEGAF